MAAIFFLKYGGVAFIAIAASGMIYLSYILANLAILQARRRGFFERREVPFSLGRWGMLVNILALVWGGSMLINFMWHRVATNPKPEETDGVLDFSIDFLNKIPILWSVLGAVLILGAIYYGARSSKIPSPVRSRTRRRPRAGSQADDPSAAAPPRPGAGPGQGVPRRGTDAHVSTTAKPPAAVLLPAGLEELLGPPESPPEPLGGGITNHNLRAALRRPRRRRAPGGQGHGAARDRPRVRARGDRRAAAAVGVGPEVIAYLDDPPTLVTEFLPGRVMTQADLGKPDMIAEVAVTLWEVHGMRPLRNRFSAWDVVDLYARTAAERGGGVAGHVRRPARAARGGSRPRSTRRTPSTRRCRATTTCCRPT